MHRARAGFRLALAHDGERVAGLSWGYAGERGQWWADRVSAALPEVATDWIGGHFELVELGVRTEARGRGIGSALLTTILGALPHDRALLTTDADPRDPGHRLYAATGWSLLGTMPTGEVVMGRRLPG